MEHEPLGREDFAEQLGIQEIAAQAAPHLVRQRRNGPDRLDLDESPVELHLEVAVEPCLGIGDGEDQWIVHDEIDAVHPLQDERVGEEQPHRAHHWQVEVHPAAQRTVLAAEELVEGRSGVEALQLERDQDGGELLLEERRRKDTGHEQIHELAVALDHAEVCDRDHQLGHLLDLLADHPHERPLGRGVVTELLGPEREQRRQAQLALEGKAVGIAVERRLEVGRPWLEALAQAEHGVIVASPASRTRGRVV